MEGTPRKGTPMRNFVIACSLVASVPVFSHADCSCTHKVQPSFKDRISARLNAMQADSAIVGTLFAQGVIQEQGEDANLRPRYVGAQGMVEQIMAQELAAGRLKSVIAVIHTPLPATPLCTEGEITPDLVDPAILRDERRLLTVRERPAIIRAFLQSGGVLMAAYPAEARTKRSVSQLAVFDALLAKHPNTLLDIPLNCEDVSAEMIGATYLMQSAQGEWWVYSVRFTQAISPSEPTIAAMWFGQAKTGPAADRLLQVSDYLLSCKGPDLMAYVK